MDAPASPLDIFERLVDEEAAQVPEPFASALDDVALIVEEQAPQRNLYGLYQGVPTTAGTAPSLSMPPRITIYMHPMVDHFRTWDELRHQVRITVLHELGHHLGMSEQHLHDLGYA